MDNVLACRFLNNLFGPNSAPAPIWGSHEALSLLAQDVNAGSYISESTSTTGLSESAHAIQSAVDRLQRAGRIPNDLEQVQSLADEQRTALGFESTTLGLSFSIQDMGVPTFLDLDLAVFLAALRFVARYQELKNGVKPVFQVGVPTLTVQGIEQQFFAQTFLAEAGEVTDTIWLYRWCVMSYTGKHMEHWRAFDGLVAMPQIPEQPQAQTVLHNVLLATPAQSSTGAAPEESTQQQPENQSQTRNNYRTKRYKNFQHAHLSDAELFAAPSDLIQGDAILRLAHSYSNRDIFERINASNPESQKIKSVNVITKRLTHAIKEASKASGRSVEDFRAQLIEAKSAQGVVHKGKANVTPYG